MLGVLKRRIARKRRAGSYRRQDQEQPDVGQVSNLRPISNRPAEGRDTSKSAGKKPARGMESRRPSHLRAKHIYPSVKFFFLSSGSRSNNSNAGGTKKIAATII